MTIYHAFFRQYDSWRMDASKDDVLGRNSRGLEYQISQFRHSGFATGRELHIDCQGFE